jgi:hypothetical protein
LKVFDIPAGERFRLRDFDANHTGLYFLLQSKDDASSIILHTDAEGNSIRTSSVSSGIHTYGIRISPAGESAILAKQANTFSLLLFDGAGALVQALPIAQFLGDYRFPNSKILIAIDDRLKELAVRGPIVSTSVRIQLDPPFQALCLPNGRVLTVALLSASTQLADLSKGEASRPTVLLAPEIQGVLRPQNAAIIGASTASPDGRVYLLVSGHKVQDGAAVLEYDADLRLLSRLRCRLPVHPKGHEFEHNYHFPSLIGISGSSIFIVDRRARRVARYVLPLP